MIALLAWRNLWRNKNRSLITAASVFFAVLLAVSMRSLQFGTYDRMIDNLAGMYTGYLQIHRAGYWDDRSLDNSFAPDAALERKLRTQPGLMDLAPRLESFALASTGNLTTAAAVAGIDPEKETKITNLAARVTAGSYLARNDAGALVAEELARQLHLAVGDTLFLLGQGYHGAGAAGRYPVRGLVRFGSPELNSRMVYLALPAAQTLFAADGRLTAWVARPSAARDVPMLRAALRKTLGKGYEVMDWEEMLPELKQAIAGDKAGGTIMIGVLYLIIAFGIFSTLLMMTHERRREFGMLAAIGMHRTRLAAMVLLESLGLIGLGAAAGLGGSLPVVLWFAAHPLRFTGQTAVSFRQFGMEPVMPAATHPFIFFDQGAVVLVLAAALAVIPALRVWRLDPLASMGK